MKVQFKTLHGSVEDYSINSKGDKHFILKDESLMFQQLIKKQLRFRVLDMITTDHLEAVKRSRFIDGSIKSVVDRYLGDAVVFYLVYGYAYKDDVKVKAVEPITLIR